MTPGYDITRSALPDNYMKVTVTAYAGMSCRYILDLTSANTADLHQVPKGHHTQPGWEGMQFLPECLTGSQGVLDVALGGAHPLAFGHLSSVGFWETEL